MKQVKPLFIMGNKRCGTSLLVKLLNLHPNLFVTHESDIIWILYQAKKSNPSEFKTYPWDGPLGMQATLTACRSILHSCLDTLSQKGGVARAFFSVQEHLMRYGSPVQQSCKKSNLAWIGDKKPVQHGDPRLRGFIGTHFPNAHFLHIVRHPRSVVFSMIRAAKTWQQGVPRYWRGTSQEILERWVIHEEWVLKAKSLNRGLIHTLRLEDLCEEPVEKMADVFEFLAMAMSKEIVERIRELVSPTLNHKYNTLPFRVSSRANRIMKIYGYQCD
jgi:Sulfotransferase family